MNATAIVVVLVVLIAAVAIGAWFFYQQRRRAELRQQFGPEYDRTVADYGERERAEKALSARAERVAELHIRTLSPADSARYNDAWRQVQTRFVDDPERSIGDADRLCGEVMQARGYPMADFEQRAADISVDHPQVVEHYRAAHAIAAKAKRGDASTEELRQAMVHYRTLIDDLIETREPAHKERSRA
jgi:hypothetical protein